MFHGKTHYVYGHFQEQTVSLPEGILKKYNKPIQLPYYP